MGYTITYPSSKKTQQLHKRHRRMCVCACACLFTFVFLICLYQPELRDRLQSFLLPGDPAVTVAAMEEFSGSLKSGASLWDGLTLFCLRILEGAKLAAN